jgi:hypothetical protein
VIPGICAGRRGKPGARAGAAGTGETEPTSQKSFIRLLKGRDAT